MWKVLVSILAVTASCAACGKSRWAPAAPAVPGEVKPYITKTLAIDGPNFRVKTLSSDELVMSQGANTLETRKFIVLLFEDRQAVVRVLSGGYSGGLQRPGVSLEYDAQWSFREGKIVLKDLGAIDLSGQAPVLKLEAESALQKAYAHKDDVPLQMREEILVYVDTAQSRIK